MYKEKQRTCNQFIHHAKKIDGGLSWTFTRIQENVWNKNWSSIKLKGWIETFKSNIMCVKILRNYDI